MPLSLLPLPLLLFIRKNLLLYTSPLLIRRQLRACPSCRALLLILLRF
jgi:hypothetical protein